MEATKALLSSWQTNSLEAPEYEAYENANEKRGSRLPGFKTYVYTTGPWIVLTFLFGITSIVLALKANQYVLPRNLLQGFSTDFEDARPAIAYHQRVFDTSMRWNESSARVELVKDDKLPWYVGTPSPEIDRNWEDMLHGLSPLSFLQIEEKADRLNRTIRARH